MLSPEPLAVRSRPGGARGGASPKVGRGWKMQWILGGRGQLLLRGDQCQVEMGFMWALAVTLTCGGWRRPPGLSQLELPICPPEPV